MSKTRLVPQRFLDIGATATLVLALAGIYGLDRSIGQSSHGPRSGLLDPENNVRETGNRRNPLDPAEPATTSRQESEESRERLAAIEQALVEAFRSQRENLADRPVLESAPHYKPPGDSFAPLLQQPMDSVPIPEVPTSSIPEEPPPLLNTLQAPRPSEQVRFFKLEAKADSVVFLVDGSGSMNDNRRFERAQAELARAIGELNQNQTFSVAFFNHGFVFLPGPGGKKPALTRATSKTKANAISWMQRLNADGGTNPEPAMTVAAHLKPQVIFLLTDGEFRPLSSNTFHLLRDREIQVYTIGFDSYEGMSNLKSISAATGGSYRSANASEAPNSMFLASSGAVLAALDSPDPNTRLAAVMVAFSRELTYVRRTLPGPDPHRPSTDEMACVRKLPGLLKDPDDRVRKEVHRRFVLKAMGSNFGPSNFVDEEITSALERWTLWCSCCFEREQPQVLKTLTSTEPNDQWVAASVIRIAGWNVADELIANLGRVSKETRREIRAALQGLAEGKDFGPEVDASDEQIAQSVKEWSNWRAAENERVEREKLAKSGKAAEGRMRVAEMHWQAGNRGKAREIWEEIIQKFAGTAAAIEAEKKLQN